MKQQNSNLLLGIYSMIILTTIGIFYYDAIIRLDSIHNDIKHTKIKTIFVDDASNRVKNYVLDNIKQHEGLRLDPYLCPAGYPTIGYGVRIPSLDHRSITIEEADSMLLYKFLEAYIAALRLSPILVEDMYKHYAIAHFIYAKGSGAYRRSKLRTLVNKGKPIEKEMRRWNKYTKDGNTVVSSHMSRINEWRIKLYNGEIKL